MRTQRRHHSISYFRYTPLVAALGIALAPASGHAANTFTVTDLSDSVETIPSTLRAAIQFFNGADPETLVPNCTGSGDLIKFDLSGTPSFTGPFTVSLAAALPVITCEGLTIDGLLPPGPGVGSRVGINPLVPDAELNANGLQSGTMDVAVLAKNLQIYGFSYGTALLGNINSDSNFLGNNQTGLNNQGNFGTSVTNSVIQANATGLYISYGGNVNSLPVGAYTATITGNTITGDSELSNEGICLDNSKAFISGNTIGNNTSAGIYIEADQGSNISGNHIGTDASGAERAPNFVGIEFGNSGSMHTTIHDNTISGNTNAGIDVSGFSDIHINNNYIGTNSSGSSSLGNATSASAVDTGGIVASCGVGLVISGNTISGNGPLIPLSHGIALFGVQSGGTTTTISDNKIGVLGDGVTALGNGGYGVLLASGNCVSESPPIDTTGVVMPGNLIGHNVSHGIKISGGSNNSIVGTSDAHDNKIFSNGGDGVDITSGVNNAITGYLIYGNGAKNIDLGAPGGPLPNDLGGGDADGGPNHGQNYPYNIVATRDFSASSTTVNFTLDTLPGLYQIDVYSNATAAVPGGDALVGTTHATFNVVSAGPMNGQVVVPSVTADNFSLLVTRMTDSETPAETSEFSPVVTLGAVPSVSITPATGLNFGPVAVNTDSPPLMITITSNGSAPYTINAINDGSCTSDLAICYGGAFTCTNHCAPGSYNPGSGPGSSCQITATFHPTAITSYSDTIAICDNAAPGSPSRTITLTGSGITPPPVLIIPSAFDFGTTLIRTSSPPHRFTIYNPGGSPVAIGPPATTINFVLNNTTCGTSLAPTATCVADVSFAPEDLGPITGTLSIGAVISSDLSSKVARKAIAPVATSALSGNSVIQAVLDLPTAIDFGAYTAGTPAIRKTVTLRNDGNTVLLPTLSVTGPFVLTNGCPLRMLPGDSCDVTLDYSAPDLGDHAGTLVVVSNAVGGTRTIPLTAHTVAIAAPQISVNAVSIGFGNSLLGFATSAQRVIITNVGNAPAALSPPTVSTTDFLVTTTCGITLAPTSTCFADVTFRPAGFGPRFGSLLVSSNAADSPKTVDLAGTGCRPFSSSSSRFGTRFGCAP